MMVAFGSRAGSTVGSPGRWPVYPLQKICLRPRHSYWYSSWKSSILHSLSCPLAGANNRLDFVIVLLRPSSSLCVVHSLPLSHGADGLWHAIRDKQARGNCTSIADTRIIIHQALKKKLIYSAMMRGMTYNYSRAAQARAR